MNELEIWIERATRRLSKAAAVQVRTEITEHYESAREAAIAAGDTDDDAARTALSALGDAKQANCQYRQVLLTADEERILQEGDREARFLCSRLRVKWLLVGLPLASVPVAAILLATGRSDLARTIILTAAGVAPLPLALLLRIRTRFWGRVFRCVRAMVMLGSVLLLFGHDALRWSWLIVSCLWPLVWSEWRRAAIRRKLPLTAWPRHLYF
jgi:hypothetical protein